MKQECVLVRVGEIALKSPQVQRKFFNILLENIGFALEGKHKIETERNRIFIYTKQLKRAMDALGKVFGITSVSPVYVCGSDLDEMKKLAIKIVKLGKTKSFAVRARRAGQHKFSSQKIAEEVGAFVKNKTNAKVDLENPDLEIFIECRQNKAYVFTEKIPCSGGMPIGTAGRVICPVSSLNSVVAAWLMMKRGCELTVLDFLHNKKLIEKLEKWHKGRKMEAYKMKRISEKTKMLETADKIAKEKNIIAIIGDETLDTPLGVLRGLDRKSSVLILRPLMGLKRRQISLYKKLLNH